MGQCLSITEEILLENNQQSSNHSTNQSPNQATNNNGNQTPQQGENHERLSLSKLDPKVVTDVPYKDVIIRAFVYDVYDGDSINCIIDVGNYPLKLSIRILGIDTPEIKASTTKLPEEKIAAIKVRDFLISLIPMNQYHNICLKSCDKYGGRYLGDVFTDKSNKNVAEIMIEKGYAKPYYGEKKSEWTLEELNLIISK